MSSPQNVITVPHYRFPHYGVILYCLPPTTNYSINTGLTTLLSWVMQRSIYHRLRSQSFYVVRGVCLRADRLLGTMALSTFQLFSKLWVAILLKLLLSTALAVGYLISKICEWKILLIPIKWVFNLGFYANISRKVWNFGIRLHRFEGLQRIYCLQKFEVLVKNFPIGGAKRFDL